MSEPDNTHAVTWTNRSTMTPADVIHDSLMDTFVGMYDDGPNSRDCQTAADGIMRDLADVPRGVPSWDQDHPARAAAEFAESHPEFVLETPPWPFNESTLSRNLTHWPDAWLRRR